MASTALFRRLPSPLLSSPQIFHPLRPSRAMRALPRPQPHTLSQVASSNNSTPQTFTIRSHKVELQESHSQIEQTEQARALSSEIAMQQWNRLTFAIAMACPVLVTALLTPHDASAATAIESGQILLLSAAEVDPGTAKLAITILGPLFAVLNLMFIVRIVMSWYPQLPVGKFPFSIAYAPTEPVLGPTRRLIPPVGGVDVAPVIWVALMSFLNEILLGQQGLLVLLSQQQP
ncbi:uncharacterized protein [Physcomitrium patens]|uniref:Uncharacterized protein n=1 Tax=Physcomitrium patens TaxID=3218 RepID=A9SD86_PHYPA|nr:ylmG homolog protein 1-1, chloroplastic-like [Physcomitrium patens]XP_024387129.1 ylmG homolog protein 1-1, chloroplastic-like [Physcomitrium patens]XP_024387130.1 ylmG homolog protein 1-1, chloroplastic-like [Physcomitrium patens]PNR47011.1 hypothetical protein PHYPA_014131 [Physcomitrium patens]|eukprot:XP_024387128.1 ylmG homolog protein 1-1, chloroplastic-like [Physcomitrella patens]